MNTTDSFKLFDEIKNGDFNAFKILFDEYWYDLYKYGAKVIGNKEDAEDLIQELFTNIWENRKRISVDTNVRVYLFGCLRKKILKRFRDKGIQEKNLEVFRLLLGDRTETPLSSIVSKDLLNTFMAQLGLLPSREKEVFILNQIDGFSIKEIAAKFSTSEQTVRNQINNALHKVEPILNKLLN